MNKPRNCSIDLFRYPCALLVLTIHTSPLMESYFYVGYFISLILAKIAVPYFFVVSGYYYFAKMEKGEAAFAAYFKRLIKPYLIWSVIFWIVDFVQWAYTEPLRFLSQLPISFITGSHFHLWFFPCMFFSIGLVSICYRLKIQKILIPLALGLYIIGCLGSSYYELGIRIPIMKDVLQVEGFWKLRNIFMLGYPFFIGGGILYGFFSNRRTTNTSTVFLMSGVLWMGETALVYLMKWNESIICLVSLYPLVLSLVMLLLQNPCESKQKLALYIRTVANFTYYSHPLFINILIMILNPTNTVLFLLTALATLFFGCVIHRCRFKMVKMLAI